MVGSDVAISLGDAIFRAGGALCAGVCSARRGTKAPRFRISSKRQS